MGSKIISNKIILNTYVPFPRIKDWIPCYVQGTLVVTIHNNLMRAGSGCRSTMHDNETLPRPERARIGYQIHIKMREIMRLWRYDTT